MTTKTARPILMNGDMILATLDNRKTQTRRPLKVQPRFEHGCFFDPDSSTGYGIGLLINKCPFGKSGDLLWMRERTMVTDVRQGEIRVKYMADDHELDRWIPFPDRLEQVPQVGKCLSMGCYREASRLTLEVTDIRVERLREISTEDAIAEGCKHPLAGSELSSRIGKNPEAGEYIADERTTFAILWDSIYKKQGIGWVANPWVWVIKFQPIFANVDGVLK